MKSLLRIPKIQMFISLLGIAVFAIAANFSFGIVLRYSIIFGFTLGIEYLFWKIRKIEPFLPSASFVTATIIFLLSEPTGQFYLPLIAVFFGVLQKQLIRPWGNHIFNPAAFGLFFSSYFGNLVSWWGPNANIVTFLIILFAAGYISFFRLSQWKIIIPFVLTVISINFFRSGEIVAALSQLATGSFLFFVFVMLPEPMTAAKGKWTKPFYGFLAATLPFALINLAFSTDLQLVSLLTVNLIFTVLDRKLG